MASDSLSALQRRILRALSRLEPPWTLTGGGALAIHLGHRTTRDLDLFWRARDNVHDVAADASALLRTHDLDVSVLRTSPRFVELRVSHGDEVCVVDLVAEPSGPVDQPHSVVLEGTAIAVDSCTRSSWAS